MPLLETILTAPTAKDSFESFGATANSPRSDSEFGRFMDNALPATTTGDENATPAKTKPTAKTKPLTAKLFTNAKPVNGAGEFFPEENPGAEIMPPQKPPGISDAVKPPVSVAGQTDSVNLIGALPPELVSNSAPPIFLTLPLAGQFHAGAVNEPVKTETEKSGGTEVENILSGTISAPTGIPADRSAGLRPGGFTPQPQLAGSETGAPVATENSQASVAGLKLADLSPLDLAGLKTDAVPAGTPSTRSAGTGKTDELAERVLGAPILPATPANLKTVAAATVATPPATTPQISISDLNLVLPPVATTAVTTTLTATADNSVEVISSSASPTAGASAEKVSPASSPFYAAMSASAASEKFTRENAGTGVAPDAGAMKNAENVNKVAGLDAKVLPGGKVGRAANDVAPQLATVSARTPENSGSDFNLPPMLAGAANPSLAENAGVIALPSLTDAHLRTVERTQEMVVMHALRLAKSDAESLSVVIRPGGGAELSLELRQRNGEVEALAVLQRGDFQMLNQHWPELQAKLELRGIKLAALGGEANGFSFAGGGNFSGQNFTREEQTQRAAAFAEFTMAMNRGGATARHSPAVTGNEWWA